MRLVAVFFLAYVASLSIGADAQVPKPFAYDRNSSVDLKELSKTERDGVTIYDISYASPKGGRVPAYLVVPGGKGPFGAIVFAHWANTEKSPTTSNRSEFLEEAVAFAQAGAVSLLIDAPFARAGFKPDTDPFSSQDADVIAQMVVDVRRGIDLLSTRKDVDRKRIAYVGHSFNAGVGAVLRGVEPRFKTLVLMAGNASVRALLTSDEPRMVKFREKYGTEKINAWLKQYDWADPESYAGQKGRAPVFIQDATRDEFGSEANFRRQTEFVAEPKTIKWYDAKHALNAQARKDRLDWLQKYIGLGNLPPGTIDKVPAVN